MWEEIANTFIYIFAVIGIISVVGFITLLFIVYNTDPIEEENDDYKFVDYDLIASIQKQIEAENNHVIF